MSLEDTIEKLVDSKIEKAMQGGPQTVLAEYKGTDSQGKGWVVIAGSTESTPITRATVEAAPGDTVSVTIGDGKCVMDANISNPSAGVAGVRKAEMTANQAQDDAEKAIAFSQQASTAASSAQASAQAAGIAADDAKATADAVHGIADQAQSDAATAKTAAEAATDILDGMQEAAEAAGTTLEGIYQDAKDAETAANSAQSSASAATRSLSDVERVVGTLNWISEHGEYVNQAGQTFDASKVYYTRSGTAPNYVYTVVPEPVAADIASYYLLRVDESVQNYLASHLWMDDYGLNLSVDGVNDYRIHQGTLDGTKPLGTYIVNENNESIACFSDTLRLGKLNGQRVILDYHSLQMFDRYGINYLHISDLRGSDGYGTVVEEFTTEFPKDIFKLQYSARGISTTTVEIDGVPATVLRVWYDEYYDSYVGINPTAPAGSIVKITYQSSNSDLKAFTFNSRVQNSIIGVGSFSEAISGIASGKASHVEGVLTKARGDYSHAEGHSSEANNWYSHAEGYYTVADALATHAEGTSTVANAMAAHAEGGSTVASASCSHAQNFETIAASNNQTALGKYNVEDANGTYAVIIGNGTSDSARSNALAVRWNGLVDQAGRTAYPLFIYNGKPTEANAPVKPCFIYDTSDGGLYYYSG